MCNHFLVHLKFIFLFLNSRLRSAAPRALARAAAPRSSPRGPLRGSNRAEMATAATHQHQENVCVVCTGHLPVMGSSSLSQWMGDSMLRGSICGNCKQVRLSRNLPIVALPHSRTARFLFLSTHHRNHSRKRSHDFSSQNSKRCVKALLPFRGGRQTRFGLDPAKLTKT